MIRQRKKICALLMAGFMLAGSVATDVRPMQAYAAEYDASELSRETQGTENPEEGGSKGASTEKTSPADTGVPAGDTESSTGAPADTQIPSDETGASADTGLSTGDTVVPADTKVPADTMAPADAKVPADTMAPVDTMAPADAVAPVEDEPETTETEDGISPVADAGDTATITSIADVKAAATGSFTVKGTVIFVDGKNIYVQDATGGIDLYFASAPSGVAVGNVLTATGSYTTYNGLIELGSATLVGNAESGDGTLPEAHVCTIAELLADYDGAKQLQSTRVRIENAVIGEVNTSGNTTLTQTGENGTASSINIYRCPALSGISAGDTVTVDAVVGAFKAPQLRVVSAGDVTKQSSGDTVTVDDTVTIDYAQWVTGKDLGTETKYVSAAGADATAYLTLMKNGTQTAPIFTTSGGTGTNYYMGSQGLGSTGNEGYYEFAFSPQKKYGKYQLALDMRGSGTAAKEWTVSFSTDGTDFLPVTTFTIDKASTNYSFSTELPATAGGSENLYVRLTPGSKSINNGTIGTGGNHYLSGIRVTAHPVISDDICKPVKMTPASGEVVAGQELSFSTATAGAKIYYTVNGSQPALYDAAAKPQLSEEQLANGAVVTAYAAADGKADSVTVTESYTWAQVATVKAAPNGGSVPLGKEVLLTCETEGAVIRYSADDGATWEDCDGKIVLSSLPATYLVKGVKDGYKDSSELSLSYTERTSDKYNIYFGQLHSHTSYSDGAGTCEEAYVHASGVDNLDFLAVTDHSNSFDNANQASLADGSVSEEWKEGQALADRYTNGEFVSIFGFEMTWSNGLGHMNTFNSEGFQSRTQDAYSTYATALQNYYATLKTQPGSISQFNHPGTTFGDFSDFAYYDEVIDDLITTIEVGNGEGAIGSSGYFPSYEYYQRALDKGWHVAPTNNQDNHKGLWGNANTGRSVVLADSLTRENIYDAMRNYRVYATEDNDLRIYYTLDGYTMGTILEEGATGDTVNIQVELSDATDASIGTVSVITNGGLVLAEQTVSGNSGTVSFDLPNDYSYYYIKVVETDGDIAVTAPVWVGEVEAAGINSISTSEVLPVKGQALPVALELYNNEPTDMEIMSIEFTVGGETVHTVNLAEAGLEKISSMSTASYSFDYTYGGVGQMELGVAVTARLNGATKVYKSVLKLTYVTPEMVTRVLIDGTHYNDYVTGYYGGNVGNFAAIAGAKNVKVEVVTDEITPEMLESCALLVISAPARKTGTANAGSYTPSHFSDEFIAMVKNYTDNGGTLIVCGIADYQDSTDGQTATEMNRLLSGIGATTRINSDEAYDPDNNGGQPYRLYLKNYKADSRYLAGAVADTLDENGNIVSEGQKYSAYSGCTVAVDPAAEAAGKAESLVRGYDTTYSIDCKDENGNSVSGQPVYVEAGKVTALAHETLDGGANLFVAGTVFISDFEVKAELDNIWDLPYLNRTIAENILDEVKVSLPVTSIRDVRTTGQMGDVFAIEGYVTAGTSVEGNTFFDTIYVQDDTAGITVFPYSVSGLEIGTKVRITGYVDAYQGDKELQVMSSEILSGEEKHVYAPEKMSAKDAMDYEKSGGKLVQVEGKVVEALYDSAGTGVSQFWLDDGSGVHANIFIDGYILSAKTGKNELASIVKKGDTVSAVGLVYAHPEGASDDAVTCLRVRNCDEIVFVKAASEDTGNGDNTGNGGEDTGNGGGNEDTGNGGDDTGNGGGNENTGNGDAGNGWNGNVVWSVIGDVTTEDNKTTVDITGRKTTRKKSSKPSPDVTAKDTEKEKEEETKEPETETETETGELGFWETVRLDVADTASGNTVKVTLSEDSVVPREVWMEIQSRGVILEITLENGVRWRIDGNTVTEDVTDTDMSVILHTTGIPEKLREDALAGNGFIEFTLVHDGPFGFDAVLTLDAGREYAGCAAKLYYYNEESGELELQTESTVAQDGTVELPFAHASQYLLVLEGEAKGSSLPWIIAVLLAMAAAIGAGVYLYSRKKVPAQK